MLLFCYNIIYYITFCYLSQEKEFKSKIDAETDEEKQKNYYSSKEYMKLENKKKKIGVIKKKQVYYQPF